MSDYKGIYVQRLNDGSIFNVKVEDSAGTSLTLDPQDYINRGIQPDIKQLPDIDNYQKT